MIKIKSYNFYQVTIFVAFLFSTFVGVPIQYYLFSGTLFLILLGRKLSYSEIVFLLFTFIMLVLNYFYFLKIDNPANFFSPTSSEIINNIVGKVFIVINILCIYMIFKNSIKDLSNLIKAVLVFNVCVFILQFVVFIIFGHYLDFSDVLFSEPARSGLGVSGGQIWSLPRFTGLFIEPSHYGVSVGFLVLSYYCFNGADQKLLLILSLFTMVMTMSSASIFVFFIILLFQLSSTFKLKQLLIAALIPILVTVVFYSQITDIIDYQLYRLSFSSDIRMNFIEILLNRDSIPFHFGTSVFSIENELYIDKMFSESRKFSSEKDTGSIVYTMARFGFIGVFSYLLTAVVFFRKSFKVLMVFLLMSLTKITYEEPLFWVMAFSLYAFSQNISDEKRVI